MDMWFNRGCLHGDCILFPENTSNGNYYIRCEWKEGVCKCKRLCFTSSNYEYWIDYSKGKPFRWVKSTLGNNPELLVFRPLDKRINDQRYFDYSIKRTILPNGDSFSLVFRKQKCHREGYVYEYNTYGSLMEISLYKEDRKVQTVRKFDHGMMIIYSTTNDDLSKESTILYEGTYDVQKPSELPTGYGTLYNNEGRVIYEGCLENGIPHGEGVCYDHRTELFRGTFTNGYPVFTQRYLDNHPNQSENKELVFKIRHILHNHALNNDWQVLARDDDSEYEDDRNSCLTISTHHFQPPIALQSSSISTTSTITYISSSMQRPGTSGSLTSRPATPIIQSHQYMDEIIHPLQHLQSSQTSHSDKPRNPSHTTLRSPPHRIDGKKLDLSMSTRNNHVNNPKALYKYPPLPPPTELNNTTRTIGRQVSITSMSSTSSASSTTNTITTATTIPAKSNLPSSVQNSRSQFMQGQKPLVLAPPPYTLQQSQLRYQQGKKSK